MEPLEPSPCGADWSPRLSFSYGFSSKQRISSPVNSPIHDSDFEFSSFIGADLTPKLCMLTAEELFCDGKLRPLERSSESAMAEGKCREEEVCIYGGNGGRIGRDSYTENVDRKLPTIRVGAIGEDSVDITSRSRKLERRVQADALRSLTNRGDLLSASCKPDKARLPTSREEGIFPRKVERSKNAGKLGSPTSKEEVVYAEKLEMGAIAGNLRSPTSREDPIPACKRDIGSEATKLRSPTSREEIMAVCGRSDNTAEMEGTRGKAGMPTNRVRLKSTDVTMHKCIETRAPVKWRGEDSLVKSKEDDAHASQMRQFSRNPRSASMTVNSSSRLVNTTSISLNNSRCPSPSRSFSLPATTPTSPTASSSFSVFSSSSSASSRYRSKIKDFFKLKKLPPKEVQPSASSCRLPISPRSFFPFFKSKEARSANASDVAPTMLQQAHEQASASTKHVSKELCNITTSKGQVSPLENSNAISPTEQTTCREDALATSIERTARNTGEAAVVGSRYRIRHSHSEKLVLDKDGKIVFGVDEAPWNEASKSKSNNGHTESHGKQRLERGGNMINMVSPGGGGLVRHHNKGLERPIPYTSSVRVTPVLNVPSCITPSLRKTKPFLKAKTFSFESLFARKEKTLVGYTTILAPTSEG